MTSGDPDEDPPVDGTTDGADEVPDAAFVEVDVGDVDAAPPVSGEHDAGRASAVVPKRSYCERCEHFADPPSVACTHEGTEIVEVVDTDHFRVVSCPVVARRREMADLDADAGDGAD